MGAGTGNKPSKRKSPSRKVAAAFVGGALVARGSCQYVADALHITTRTFRRYVRAGRSSDGLKCVSFPVVYSLVDTDRVEEVAFGTADTLAKQLGVDARDVSGAARTGRPLKGLLVAEKTVTPKKVPFERICALRDEYVANEMARLARERRRRREMTDG